MPKKLEKLQSHEIDSALQNIARDGGPVAKAVELIKAAGKRAPFIMGHGLARSAALGHVELVKTFIAHKVDFDHGSSLPIFEAAAGGHAEIITLLIEAGADPEDSKDPNSTTIPDGRIAIFAAIQNGHADAVAALIDGGADVNRISYAQRTPLDVAKAKKGKSAKKIVALLEAAGAKAASADMLDMKGAIEANAVARVAELAKRAKKQALVDGLEHACTWADREDCVTALLLHKKKLGTDGLAVGLYWAAALGRLPALRLVLDTGIPVDTLGPHGEHALLVAADRGATESIDVLLAAGADINRVAESGKTALHGAVGGRWGKTAEIVIKLLAAGADPKVRDRKGQTPLDRAKDKDDDAARAVLQKLAGKPRSAKVINAGVLKKLADHVRTTAIPVFAKKAKADEAAGSRFGGCPGLQKGESWPTCQGCDDPLAFFCQLATDELTDELHTKTPHVIQFFYCTECEPSNCDDKGAADATLLRAVPTSKLTTVGAAPKGHKPFPAKRVDHWATRDDYPSERDVGAEKGYPLRIAIDLDEREALGTFNTAGTKCGGWPRWLQDSEYRMAGKKKLDQLVLQLDLGGPLPYEYGDGGIGFLLCVKGDPTKLGFVWQCM